MNKQSKLVQQEFELYGILQELQRVERTYGHNLAAAKRDIETTLDMVQNHADYVFNEACDRMYK